jgi:hypothetical protein
MKRALLIITLCAIALSATAGSANAGWYDVYACGDSPRGYVGNASWGADAPDPFTTAYTGCPGEGIVTRMSLGSGTAPFAAGARQVFTTPPGTRIVRLRANVNVTEFRGWTAGLLDSSHRYIWCGNGCTSYGQYLWVDLPVNTQQLFAQATCGSFGGCPRWHLDGLVAMRDVVVTIQDDDPPGVQITGGSVTQPGWHSGDQTMEYRAWDASGIRRTSVLVDGFQRSIFESPCFDDRVKACDDQARRDVLPGYVFSSDGRHKVTLRATDTAGLERSIDRDVFVDRTAPTQPLDAAVDGGTGWRPRNDFIVRWRDPAQTAAPIEAVRYLLCPEETRAGETTGCVEGRRPARDISSLSALSVPKPGAWRLNLWLEDAAGNADPARSVSLSPLRFDDTAPAMAFANPSESDPMRVRVVASDATSGLTLGQIEARRRGEAAWRSLPTSFEKGGFAAVLDDEALPKGVYDIRARAVDAAGNERTIDRMPDGETASRRLPVRISTRLAVGKRKRVRARDAHGRHRYRTILVVRPQARFGRTIPLTGRLTMPGGNPLGGADVEVWQHVKLGGAEWRRISQVRTTPTGRLRFKALKGPSRTLRFRYPGTATIRARSAEVELRVRAVTSLRVNRDHVVNGEEVRFHGRVKGRQSVDAGKLLYLQVFTRGHWSTFATPRADRNSGLWSYAYRFTGTRGRVRYRFRALVPREASFPYETGVSHSVHVTVRGL